MKRGLLLLLALGCAACARAERTEPPVVVVVKGNAEQQQAIGGLLPAGDAARLLKLMPRSQAQTWSVPASRVEQFEQALQSRGYAYAEALPPGVTTLIADDSVPDAQLSDAARRIVQEFAGEGVPFRIADERPDRVTLDLFTEAVSSNQILRLRLPNGTDVLLRRPSEDASGPLHWIAEIADGRGEAMIVVDDHGVTGTLTLPRAHYSILPLPGGQQLIFQSDRRRAPPEHPPSAPSGARRQLSAIGPMADAPPLEGCPVPQRTIDILTVYTPLAKALLPTIAASAKVAIGEAQKSLVNSGLTHIAFGDAGVEEIGLKEDMADFAKNLQAIVAMGETPGSALHQLRRAKAADLVILVVANSTFAGLAEEIYASPSTAYAAVSLKWMTGPQFSFPHEIGHLFGARHDPLSDPETRPFPFGHGYVDTQLKWRTIMAYDVCGGCPRVPHWANPSVRYAHNGSPARETGALPESHDAQVLHHTASRLSQFQCTGG